MSKSRWGIAGVAVLVVAQLVAGQLPASAVTVTARTPQTLGSRAPADQTPSARTDYAYDAAGHLAGVTQDAKGASATYDYDAAGNITSVARSAASAVSVQSVVPARGPVGSPVTIAGSGYSATVSGTTVAFNGTPATVIAATTTKLTVGVPDGASTGPVTVTTMGGSAQSRQPFTVDGHVDALAVTGFNPAAGAAGTSVTITGTGFDSNDTVSFGSTRARVTAASTTQLTATVPTAAGSGKVTVATPSGASALSASDFVAVPTGYTADQLASTGTLALDGAAAAASVTASGKVALLRFTGSKGQRLSLGLTGSTISAYTVVMFGPYGAPFGRGEYDAPQSSATLHGGIELPVLPTSGTYEVVIDPTGTATGAVTATLSSRLTAALSQTGAGTQLTFGRAGQLVDLALPATAGQRVFLGFTGSTLPAGTHAALTVREPNGTPILFNNGSQTGTIWVDGSGYYYFTPPATATYDVVLGSDNASTGAVTVTASPGLPGGALTVGTSKTVAISRAGQHVQLTFTGKVNDELNLDLSSVTYPYQPYVEVTAPDGSVVYSASTSGHIELDPLPVAGTYTVDFSDYSSTGSAKLLLSTRLRPSSITATGRAVPVALSSGNWSTLTFSATKSKPLSFAVTNWGLPADESLDVRVLDDNGDTSVSYTDFVDAGEFWFTPDSSGTYKLQLSTARNSTTGTVAVTLATEQAGGTLAANTPKAVAAPRAGQTTRLSFSGTSGQRVSLSLTDYTFGYDVSFLVLKPNGDVLWDNSAYDQIDLDPLPSSGTYQLVVYPYGETGSMKITLAQRATNGSMSIGGAASTMTFSQPYRYVETTFSATAGQKISVGASAWSLPADDWLLVRMLGSDGSVIADYPIYSDGFVSATVPKSGTYRFIASPPGPDTGSVSLLLSQDLQAGSLTLNTAKTVTIGRSGQNAVLTYSGTTGQNLQLSFSHNTMRFRPYVWIGGPTGSTFASDNSDDNPLPLPTVAATGTYQISLNGYAYPGSVTVTIEPRDTSGKAAPQVQPQTAKPPRVAPKAPPVLLHRKAQGGVVRQLPVGHSPFVPSTVDSVGNQAWTPDKRNLAGADWNTHRPSPTAKPAAALVAPQGKTALSGRLATLDGRPLARVAVSADSVRATSDGQGRFLLTGVSAGHHALRVDGSTANSAARTFGLFDIGVDVAAGRTTALPYTIWMSTLDTKHVVSFASPATSEVIVTNPAIPGLEVHLPKGAVVRDVNGKVVTKLGITAIPVDRPPFPLPRSNVPVYFTVQPGSSYVFPTGARVIYPNYTHAAAGAVMDFWHYDPAGRGWFVYGHGKVTANGRQVVPDPGTAVYQFTGAMLIEPGVTAPPTVAPVPGNDVSGGDPVDLGTGLLTATQTDLALTDTLPLSVTRTYQQSDTGQRAFGVGSNFEYDMYLYSTQQWVTGQLVLPDGGAVTFHRTSPGSTGGYDYLDAVFAADPTPTAFNGAVMAWNGDGFDIRLRDGTTLVFGEESPLQAIRDRYGNTITITRALAPADPDGKVRAKGPITQVTSPNGRWISFGYDSANRVTNATDNTGRTVAYTYDTGGHLSTVTDPTGAVSSYTYDSQGRMATAKDGRGTTYLTNAYDTNGRVSKQTMADGSTFGFVYVTDAADRVTEARLTDQRGTVRRVTFNHAGFATTDTSGFGTSLAQTTTISRDPAANRPLAITDATGSRSEFTYDSNGKLATHTEQAGTAAARTERYAYNGPFDQLGQHTDWLGRVTGYGYAGDGSPRTVTDPLSRVSTMDTNAAGQLTSFTDPLGHPTTYGYLLGDQATTTDSLGRLTRVATDGVGRTVAVTNPLGAVSRTSYDADDRVVSSTDPLGLVTGYQYDRNGNLTVVTDPRSNATTYTYDTSDRLTQVKDPLARLTTIGYDAAGSAASVTTARGDLNQFGYDPLGRLSTAKYGVSGSSVQSQLGYGYDADNRVTSIADSLTGNLAFGYDLAGRVTSAGQTGYTYDAAGQRSTMTVSGQPQVGYTYDADGALTGLQRGGDTVTIGYDNGGRRASVTLPDGIAQTYGYDAASQLTGVSYGLGGTSLGALTYDYDAAGHVVRADGDAVSDIPASYGPSTYDAANQLTHRGSTNYTYDANGNLTSDGTATYNWDARGQLSSVTRAGQITGYAYDAVGRRISRTAGGTTTGYVYDAYNVVQELTGGTSSATMLTGDTDEVFARTTGAGTLSLLTDGLGSTIATADASGALSGSYRYQPYGATAATGSDQGNPTRFTGREDDGDGLYYYRSRYYSTSDNRFISTDPVGLASGGTNLYAYANGQPTNLVDPLGTTPGEVPALPSRVLVGPDRYLNKATGNIEDGAGHVIREGGGNYRPPMPEPPNPDEWTAGTGKDPTDTHAGSNVDNELMTKGNTLKYGPQQPKNPEVQNKIGRDEDGKITKDPKMSSRVKHVISVFIDWLGTVFGHHA